MQCLGLEQYVTNERTNDKYNSLFSLTKDTEKYYSNEIKLFVGTIAEIAFNVRSMKV